MTAADLKALDLLEKSIQAVLCDSASLPDDALEGTGLTLEASLGACQERIRQIILDEEAV